MTPQTTITTISVRADVGISTDRLLRAIAQAESANDDLATGRHGEITAWQMKVSVWRQHSHRPISDAKLHWIAYLVAQDHLKWLMAHMIRPTPFRLCIAWKVGLTAFKRDEYADEVMDYASRCENIYRLLR